jgi:hypothetical protein
MILNETATLRSPLRPQRKPRRKNRQCVGVFRASVGRRISVSISEAKPDGILDSEKQSALHLTHLHLQPSHGSITGCRLPAGRVAGVGGPAMRAIASGLTRVAVAAGCMRRSSRLANDHCAGAPPARRRCGTTPSKYVKRRLLSSVGANEAFLQWLPTDIQPQQLVQSLGESVGAIDESRSEWFYERE